MNMTLTFKKLQPNRWTTPGWLHAILVVNIVAALLFYLAVRAGEERHSQAVKTLSQDATTGIIAAQRVKSGLAEMNALSAEALLATSGDEQQKLVRDYSVKRQEVTASLLQASECVVYGPAEEVPIKNIGYVLPIYHKLVTEALTSKEKHDQTYVEQYRQASDLMASTLLPAADALDKANTYALNQTYSAQQSVSALTHKQVLETGLLLTAVLVLSQLYYLKRFRRDFSMPLALATLCAVAFLGYALVHFSRVQSNSRSAKEDAFDSVHVIWRARAMALTARQQELAARLDAKSAADYKRAFADAANKVVRLPDGQSSYEATVRELSGGSISDDLGGYMATELRNITFPGEREAAVNAVQTFGIYVKAAGANDTLASRQAFAQFLTQLDATRQINQDQFEVKANQAANALSGLATTDLIVALAIGIGIFVGINPRLKEYSIGA